jgi:hypothetical protein
MSAFGGKADMPWDIAECPLMTQSGHRLQRAKDQGWVGRSADETEGGSPFSRHHHSRDSLLVRLLSARWWGSDVRSANVCHLSLSPFMFPSAAFRSATCCSASSARWLNSASRPGALGGAYRCTASVRRTLDLFTPAAAAALARLCMGRCLSLQWMVQATVRWSG